MDLDARSWGRGDCSPMATYGKIGLLTWGSMVDMVHLGTR
jgi:hypothetical protein